MRIKKLLLTLAAFLIGWNAYAVDFYLVGGFNDWNLKGTGCKFTDKGDGTYELDYNGVLPSGFKINDGTWGATYNYGAQNGAKLTIGVPFTVWANSNSGNIETADGNSISNPHIVFTPSTNTLLITGQQQEAEIVYGIHGAWNGWNTLDMTEKDGKWILSDQTIDGGAFGIKESDQVTGKQTKWYSSAGSTDIVLNEPMPCKVDGTNFVIGAGTYTFTFDPSALTLTVTGTQTGEAKPDYSSWYVNVVGEFNGWEDNGVNPIDGISTTEDLPIGTKGFKIKVWNGTALYYISDGDPIPTNDWVQLYYDDADGAAVQIQGATAGSVYTVKYNVETNQVYVIPQGDVKPTYPETLYMIGYIDDHAFSSSEGFALTKESDGVFSGEGINITKSTEGGDVSYVAFAEKLDANWNVGIRYGATSENAAVQIGETMGLAQGGANYSFMAEPGLYSVKVDLTNMTVVFDQLVEVDMEVKDFAVKAENVAETTADLVVSYTVENAPENATYTVYYQGEGAEESVVATETGATINLSGLTAGKAYSYTVSLAVNGEKVEDATATASFTTTASTPSEPTVNGDAMFNFASFADMAAMLPGLPAESEWPADGTNTRYNVTDATLKVDDVEITFTQNTSTANPDYFYRTSTGVLDLRFYNNNDMTISVPEGYVLDEIAFRGSSTATYIRNLDTAEPDIYGSFEQSGSGSGSTYKIWTCPDGLELSSLVISANGTNRIGSIEVKYHKLVTEAARLYIAVGSSVVGNLVPAENDQYLEWDEEANAYVGYATFVKGVSSAFRFYDPAQDNRFLTPDGYSYIYAQRLEPSTDTFVWDGTGRWYINNWPTATPTEVTILIKVDTEAETVEFIPQIPEVKAPDALYLWGTTKGYQYDSRYTNMGTLEKSEDGDVYTLTFDVPACGLFVDDDEYGPLGDDPNYGFYFYISDNATSSTAGTIYQAPIASRQIVLSEGQTYTVNALTNKTGTNFIALNPGKYTFTLDLDKDNEFSAVLEVPFQQVTLDFTGVDKAYKLVTATNIAGDGEQINIYNSQMLFSYNQQAGIVFAAADDYVITVTAPEGTEPGESTYVIYGSETGSSSQVMLGLYGADNMTFTINVEEKSEEVTPLYLVGACTDWQKDENYLFTYEGENTYTLHLDELTGDFKIYDGDKDWKGINLGGDAGGADVDNVPAHIGDNTLYQDSRVNLTAGAGWTDVTLTLNYVEGANDATLKISATTPSGSTIVYVVGAGDGLSWDLPGKPFTGEDGVVTMNISNLSKFKVSTSDSTDWNEFNANAYATGNNTFTNAVANDGGETLSIQPWGEDQKLPYAGDYTITIDLNNMTMTAFTTTPAPEVFDIYIRGEMNDWGTPDNWKFEYDEATGLYTFNCEGETQINAGVGFKFADKDWGTVNYGYGEITLTSDETVVNLNQNENNNMKLAEPFAGTIVLDLSNKTATFKKSSEVVPFIPETLYIIGNVNDYSWNPTETTPMTPYVENGEVVKGKFGLSKVIISNAGSGDGYFSFCTQTSTSSDDWSGLGTRFGAQSNDFRIEEGNTMDLFYGSNSFMIVAGTYDIVVTFDEKGKGTVMIAAAGTVGVDGIDVESGDTEYYTIDGLKVENPGAGLYIKVQNGKASKVLIRK